MTAKSTVAGLLVAAAFAAPLALAGTANAAPKLGTLFCSSQGTTGYIIGSNQTFECQFNPVAGAAASPERYQGTLQTYGLDVGATGPTSLSWTVLALNSDATKPDALAGTYVGAGANASVGFGGGANALVGGDLRAVQLQPLSFTAQRGLNLSFGVSRFALTAENAAPTPRLNPARHGTHKKATHHTSHK